MSALRALADELRAEGGLLAEAVAAPPEGGDDHGRLAAAGSRGASDPAGYALLVEAVREGYLLHYGGGRVVRTEDEDLALLAGDRLYARGLAGLAARGDLEGVQALADLIAGCARVHAEGRAGDAEALWRVGAAAVGGAGATTG